MFGFEGLLFSVIQLAALGLGGWAVVDALVRPAPAYVAAGKLTKPAWAAITGVAVLLLLVSRPLGFLWLPALVAAIVYLVDVRPAVRGIPRGGSNW
jgi:hypothetical protein